MGQYYNAPGAAVTFVSKEKPELRYETWTNSDGNYEIVVPPGQYRVHVSWSGYPPLFNEYGLGKLNPKWSFDVKIEGCSQNLAIGKVIGKEVTNFTIDND